MIEKVAIFGLDCAEPSLVFDRWLDDLPTIRALVRRGTYGTLESCIPPITVPAWSCMAASADPGKLGIYGFRNRADHSYEKLSIATSLAVKEPRIWDILTQHGRSSVIVGVPGTYPITRSLNGCLVTSFLTPDTKAEYTWPKELKDEIAALVGEYMFDVKGFRTDDKTWLLEQIYEMTRRRFKVVRHLLETRSWDLFWMVEMGVDRIHHGFWSCMDPQHHRHDPDNHFTRAIHDYYVYLDSEIARTLELMDLNGTAVWLVSDHGAKCMAGGFCFNQWLLNEGYLVLKPGALANARGVTKFDPGLVDWSRTTAWGDGGYYARCFLNVQGREPEGIVPPKRYEALRRALIAKLEALPDDRGQPMGTRAYRPEDLYAVANGVPPDLIVILGDLRWRSVGSLGHPSLYTFENDTGPDDANHAQFGLYAVAHPSLPARGRVDGPTLYDVAPTILKLLGLPLSESMRGKALV
ncbi:MAG TPA: alkaline phosphatase family protein [Phycisphaerae bacterium]|jgi:predicted AlkP superfamily phosphohydrolase/phosphomutase